MFAKAYKHGVMQLLPHTCSIPVTQAPPTRHAAAIAQSLRQVFPSNASLQNKQDAIEGCLITDGALAAATFARCNEGRNEWFELFPQLFTNGNTRHTAAKHKRFAALQKKVALSALNAYPVDRLPSAHTYPGKGPVRRIRAWRWQTPRMAGVTRV